MNQPEKPRTTLARDERLAREIAEFVADRAFRFRHYECRAWALTDFEAWAALSGRAPMLTLGQAEST